MRQKNAALKKFEEVREAGGLRSPDAGAASSRRLDRGRGYDLDGRCAAARPMRTPSPEMSRVVRLDMSERPADSYQRLADTLVQ